MRGWVYVLTNKSFQGLVKIGFSTKDPELRAEELTGTGHPHPFFVAYEALIENPRDVEQAVHAELKSDREAKEFFQVTVELAVRTIHKVLANQCKSIFLEGGSYRSSHESPPKTDGNIRKAKALRPAPPATNGLSRTVRFVGNCGYCLKEFALTLTRRDSGAVCPYCFNRNNVSDFLQQAFPI